MKKNLIKTIALAGALCMALPMFASCKKGGNEEQKITDAKSYVSVDINPSLSLVLDGKDKVVSVHAENEDAQIMLYGEKLKGLKIDAALDEIAKLSVDLGYVNDENHGVSLNVSGKLNENKLIADLQASYNKDTGNLNVTVGAEGTFTDLRVLESIKAEYASNVNVKDLSLSDIKLIVDAQSVDGTLTFEEALAMSKEELMNLVANGAIAIEPYATKAYDIAVRVAERAYNEAKGGLIDALWTVPYTKDLGNIVTGNRKYPVNNGVIYNIYRNSSRALGVTIDTMEDLQTKAEETEIGAETIDKIALALELTPEEKTQFVSEITVNGKVTVASLEKYLNRWYKNMTADERAAAEQAIMTAVNEVKTFVTELDAQVAEEYKAALRRLVKDLTGLVPQNIKDVASEYYNEFESLVTSISTAAEGKEPVVAMKAVKEVFDTKSAVILEKIKGELTEEDLKSVEDSIKLVNDKLTVIENRYAEAKKEAEASAKAWLEEMKASRKAN